MVQDEFSKIKFPIFQKKTCWSLILKKRRDMIFTLLEHVMTHWTKDFWSFRLSPESLRYCLPTAKSSPVALSNQQPSCDWWPYTIWLWRLIPCCIFPSNKSQLMNSPGVRREDINETFQSERLISRNFSRKTFSTLKTKIPLLSQW